MNGQMFSTRAKSLGPFLTLILLSSPRREHRLSEVSGGKRQGSFFDPEATLEMCELAYEAQAVRRTPPLKLGPFLTLILTVACNWSHSERHELGSARAVSAPRSVNACQSTAFRLRAQVQTRQ
jgi:hypothetical protein